MTPSTETADEEAVFPKEVAGTLELASSLIHGGDETLGTTRLFRSKGMIVEGEKRDVPVVSGNAIRGIWRRACAKAFLDEYLAAGGDGLSLSAFYYLTSGGSLQKGSASKSVRLEDERRLHDLIPHAALFGGAGLGRIQPGKMWVDEAYPICRETVPILRRIAPDEMLADADTVDTSVRELTEVHGYSRQDDAKDTHWHKYLSDEAREQVSHELQATESSEVADEAGSPQQMRYENVELVTGTPLFHRWGFRWPPTRHELAGLGSGLLRWAERPHIGGRNAVGHGNLLVDYQGVTPQTELITDGSKALEGLRDQTVDQALRDHVQGHLGAIEELLTEEL